MSERTVQDVIDAMSEEQQAAVYTMLAAALGIDGEDLEQSGLDDTDLKAIFDDGVKYGSLKDSVLTHAEDYGIQDIESLFPSPTELNNPPKVLNNPIEWVAKILNGVSKSPFSRIRTTFADITDESLRAKGYLKTHKKKEAVITLLRRSTSPTTVYKKQKIDRDDIIDITDFNVVSFIKDEMKLKLDEEIARAILIGDGRLASDEDKIDEECVRPVVSDDDLYTIKYALDSTIANKYKAFITACIKSRKDYRGAGQPTLFTTEDTVAEMLLLEDNNGRRIYTSVSELCSVMRVKEIVTMPDLENFVRKTTDSKTHTVMGIVVNLIDYKVGADRGGQTAMFDDFDIDYNQYKYLIETRRSGALVTPYSAITIEEVK